MWVSFFQIWWVIIHCLIFFALKIGGMIVITVVLTAHVRQVKTFFFFINTDFSVSFWIFSRVTLNITIGLPENHHTLAVLRLRLSGYFDFWRCWPVSWKCVLWKLSKLVNSKFRTGRIHLIFIFRLKHVSFPPIFEILFGADYCSYLECAARLAQLFFLTFHILASPCGSESLSTWSTHRLTQHLLLTSKFSKLKCYQIISGFKL